MKITIIIASILSMIGLVLSWFSGWFIYRHSGIIAAFARSFNIHGIQAISTAILTIIVLAFAIGREIKKNRSYHNV